jgi:hypothetical protein
MPMCWTCDVPGPSGRGRQDSRFSLEPCSLACGGGDLAGPGPGRPIAAPLERCAELLGVGLATVGDLAARVEPYVRADGARISSLMQLEQQLRPEAYGRRRGGYLDRRQTPGRGCRASPAYPGTVG